MLGQKYRHFPYIRLFDLPVYAGSLSHFIELLVQTLSSYKGQNSLFFPISTHDIVLSKQRLPIKDIFTHHSMTLPDSRPLFWIGKRRSSHITQCRGVDIMRYVLSAQNFSHLKHFFCGSSDEVLQCIQTKLSVDLPHLKKAEVYSPPFVPLDQYDYEDISRRITEVGTDILWIGLGAPKQMEFAYTLSQHTHVSAIFVVGAAFDFFSGNKTEAPTWLRKLSLEWLFRLLQEPKRLFRRYTYVIPYFLYYYLIKRDYNSKT